MNQGLDCISNNMKRTIIVAALIITALSFGILGQTPRQNSNKDEKAKNKVIALADAFFNASVKMDAQAIERILSDDYKGIQSSEDVGDYSSYGFPIGKDLLIRFFKEARQNGQEGLPLTAIKMDEDFTSVRVYGETAVLVTKITLKWQGSREELVKKYRFMPRKDDFIVTMVTVKKNGDWQIAATHQSEFQIKARLSPDPK